MFDTKSMIVFSVSMLVAFLGVSLFIFVIRSQKTKTENANASISLLQDQLLTEKKLRAELEIHHNKTEQALKSSDNRLTALLEQVDLPILKINHLLYIIAVNSVFQTLTGVHQSELLGRNINVFPQILEKILELSNESFYLKADSFITHKKLIWHLTKICPTPDETSHYYLLIGIEQPNE